MSVASLNRFALKVEQAEELLQTLAKRAEVLQSELDMYPGAKPPNLKSQRSPGRDPHTTRVGTLTAKSNVTVCRPLVASRLKFGPPPAFDAARVLPPDTARHFLSLSTGLLPVRGPLAQG